jgi:probable phosphoglycerate mutase
MIHRLYIVRHGQTQWNVEKRMQGWKDSPLTEEGIVQAKRLSEKLKSVDFHRVLSSPSSRTMQTARILMDHRSIPLEPMEAFREIRLGRWEGMHYWEIQERYADAHERFWNRPSTYQPIGDGETFIQARNRILPALEHVIQSIHGQSVLLVTHAATKKLIMSYFENRPLDLLWEPPYMHHTAMSIIRFDQNEPFIELYADHSHLIGSIL